MNDRTVTGPEPDLDFDYELEPERYELQAGPDLPAGFDRRAFLRGLGGGLAVLCLVRADEEAEASPAPQQESGRGGRRGGGQGAAAPRVISAWLHVADDGAITAYSGKAEVGQNARTSLTQAVADELRAPVESVRMVLGDTAKCPFDMGTFGSRTTPAMVPQLRKAAAAAREVLLATAAKRWVVDRGSVEAAGGSVKNSKDGRRLSYGELSSGLDQVQTIGDDTPTTPASRWTAAGKSVPKVDGRAFVTGGHRFTSDVKRPGMLCGKVLRPASFGARLAGLDTSGAEAVAGAKVVRDGDFVGVVAPDEPTAARALAALRPKWDENPPACSDRDISDYLKAHAQAGGQGGQGGGRGAARSGGGSSSGVAEALKAADVSVERTYQIAYIAHTPLEPRAAVAEWEGDKLTVWTGTQRPFGVRSDLARALNVPEEKVRVIVPDTGAGYGGKHTGEAAVEAARLAKAAGKPVRLVWTREEEFTWAYFRPGGVIEAAGGVRKDGTLTAWRFLNINSGGSGVNTPYDVPQRDESFRASASPLKQGSYRALASTANHFARESLMDELAHKVQADPLAFRLKNLKNDRLRAVLEAAAERFGWGRSPSGGHGNGNGHAQAQGEGAGIACGVEKGGYVATCARVKVDPSTGAVKVVKLVTAFECGAVVNPDHLTNQVQGALMMGIGGALFEAVKFEGGKILNPRLSRYRVPRFSDAPAIEVVLIDRKDLPAAGAGETPIVAVAPAIGNAIFEATGTRLTSMPMAPDGLKT
jgi:isoquinoline 1-oxidoreductase